MIENAIKFAKQKLGDRGFLNCVGVHRAGDVIFVDLIHAYTEGITTKTRQYIVKGTTHSRGTIWSLNEFIHNAFEPRNKD